MKIENHKYVFSTIEDAAEDIKNGKMIIIVDDEDRENEGDLVCAAEKVTPEIINFMVTHARGFDLSAFDRRTLRLSAIAAADAGKHFGFRHGFYNFHRSKRRRNDRNFRRRPCQNNFDGSSSQMQNRPIWRVPDIFFRFVQKTAAFLFASGKPKRALTLHELPDSIRLPRSAK